MMRMYSLLLSACLLLAACTTPAKKEPESPDAPPKLLAANVKKIWIPPAFKNGGIEWEAGHYLYRIERGTTWSR